MSAPAAHPGPRPAPTRAQVCLYGAGYAVLVLGTLGAARAYRVGLAYDARNAAVAGLNGATKEYERQMEVLGGKSNVFAYDLQQKFLGLWHGTHLAYTLAVLSLVAALACFFTAYFLPDFPPFDDSPLEPPGGPRD